MKDGWAETLMGAVVLAVAGGFVVYAANTADLGLRSASGYELSAQFRKAEGIAPGADVRIAGVKIGSVSDMRLDPESYQAEVVMRIDQGVQIPDDSAAKITSTSLLGDSYIAVDVGASEFMLEAGDEIAYTQSSISVSDLIGRFIQGAPAE